jgi:hypothetical protein
MFPLWNASLLRLCVGINLIEFVVKLPAEFSLLSPRNDLF